MRCGRPGPTSSRCPSTAGPTREDAEPLRRLVDQIVAGQVDAVTFTSAPAVTALLDASGDRAPAVLDAFGDRVLAACVGPVTAAPLRDRGVPALVPDRARLGALVRAVTDDAAVAAPGA